VAVRQPRSKITLADTWGRRVADRRTTLGLSQAQLADLCDVTQQTISKIEAGRMIPHDNLKLSLASRMGLEPADLFAWPARSELLDGAA